METNYNDSIWTYGAVISTNSLGSNAGSNGYPCSFNGDYETTAQLVDQIIRGSFGKEFISFWAAGNERAYSCSDNWTLFPGYNTTGVAATSKNSIV